MGVSISKMQHQGQTFPVQQPVYGAQAYPVPNVTVNVKRHYGSRVDNPDYEPRRQPLSYFLSVLFAAVVAFLGLICFSGIFFAEEKLTYTFIDHCFRLYGVFYGRSFALSRVSRWEPFKQQSLANVPFLPFHCFAFTASSPQIFIIVFGSFRYLHGCSILSCSKMTVPAIVSWTWSLGCTGGNTLHLLLLLPPSKITDKSWFKLNHSHNINRQILTNRILTNLIMTSLLLIRPLLINLNLFPKNVIKKQWIWFINDNDYSKIIC